MNNNLKKRQWTHETLKPHDIPHYRHIINAHAPFSYSFFNSSLPDLLTKQNDNFLGTNCSLFIFKLPLRMGVFLTFQ